MKLIDQYTDALLAAALGWGVAKEDAKELVQDTFVAFLEAIHRFEQRSSVKTYLFGILYNKVREMRRHQAREEAVEDIEKIFDERFDARGMWKSPPQGPEDLLERQEISEIIHQCSEGLSFDQRTAFYMKEVEGEPTDSICKILGVTVTDVGVLLFRARNKLRECLEKKWGKI